MLISSRGSLLVQLMVSVGIFALLATLSIPALRQYQPNAKLRAEGRQLTSDLRHTQQLTVTEQKVYYLELNVLGNSYNIVKQEEPGTPIKTVNLDSAVDIQSVNGFDNDQVVFNSYGAVSQAGTIILTNSQERVATIQVKPSGYVQLSE